MGREIFNEVLESIENDDMREFAKVLLDTIPSQFYHAGASSSGRYHPSYALGDGGLARHTLALVRFLNYTFQIECMGSLYTSRERDMMRIAGMIHDSRKSGNEEEWTEGAHTKFEHPILAAEVIESFDGKYLTHEEIMLISNIIKSHMGQFNTSNYSNVVLPKPITKYEKLVHWADYLASRKDIEVHCELPFEGR